MSAAFNLGLKGAWIPDGNQESAATLIEQSKKHILLIRWQWGREEVLRELTRCPEVEQHIVLLKCAVNVQLGRSCSREGAYVWSIENLEGEAKEVEAVVDRIQKEFPNIAVTKLDVTGSRIEQWRLL